MAEHTALDSAVHYRILTEIIESGHAPDTRRLASLLSTSDDEIDASLRRLHENHGLLLHPDSTRIWVIHPFSLWPTAFWVSAEGRHWWGNCAWCSLGICALLDTYANITTTLGGEHEQTVIRIRRGEVLEGNLVVHFPLPVAKAWDNVIYFCGTVLVFQSEADVDKWCERHAIAKGAVVPIRQVWQLAKVWYGNHLNPEWVKWTAAEAQAIFESVGLTGEHWAIPQTRERF